MVVIQTAPDSARDATANTFVGRNPSCLSIAALSSALLRDSQTLLTVTPVLASKSLKACFFRRGWGPGRPWDPSGSFIIHVLAAYGVCEGCALSKVACSNSRCHEGVVNVAHSRDDAWMRWWDMTFSRVLHIGKLGE